MYRFFAPILTAVLTLFAGSGVVAQDEARTVIGPRNIDLFDGAQLIKGGEPQEGVRRTLRGLKFAAGDRELDAALSNLCGGYLLLRNFDEALRFCNLALKNNENNWRAFNNRALIYIELGQYSAAREDLSAGFEIAPHASTLKKAERLLQDRLHPVSPKIIIDDRQLEPDR